MDGFKKTAIFILVFFCFGCGSNNKDITDNKIPNNIFGSYAKSQINAVRSQKLNDITTQTLCSLPNASSFPVYLSWVDNDHLAIITSEELGQKVNIHYIDANKKSIISSVPLDPQLVSIDTDFDIIPLANGAIAVVQLKPEIKGAGAAAMTVWTVKKVIRVDIKSGKSNDIEISELTAVLREKVALGQTDPTSPNPGLYPCKVYNFLGSEVQVLPLGDACSGIPLNILFPIGVEIRLNEMGRVYGAILAKTDDTPESPALLAVIDYDGDVPTLIKVAEEGLYGPAVDAPAEKHIYSFSYNSKKRVVAWIMLDLTFSEKSEESALALETLRIATPGKLPIVIDWSANYRSKEAIFSFIENEKPKTIANADDWSQTALANSPISWSPDGNRIAYIINGSIKSADVSKFMPTE